MNWEDEVRNELVARQQSPHLSPTMAALVSYCRVCQMTPQETADKVIEARQPGFWSRLPEATVV